MKTKNTMGNRHRNGRRLSVVARAAAAFLMAGIGAIAFMIDPHAAQRAHGTAVAQGTPHIGARFAALPIVFEQNEGQFASRVKFLSRGPGYALFLTVDEAVMKLRSSAKSDTILRMKLVGASARPEVGGVDRVAGVSNYFIGKDPARWRTGVPNFGRVKYSSVYPGIDVVYRGNSSRGLEYDFTIAPGASPDSIKMRYSGARKISLDRGGNLAISFNDGELIQPRPMVYQLVNGARHPIRGEYVLRGPDSVGFAVAAYDRTRPLVIDPALLFLTYLGGTSIDHINAIVLDGNANVYVAGRTASPDFPVTAGVFQHVNNTVHSENAFVAKMNSTGTKLLYSTYLGGSVSDSAFAVALDSNGNAYVAGRTSSPDFPVTSGAFQTTAGSTDFDGFVTELNATGTALVYSTYLGGEGADQVNGIALDSANNAYLAGQTASSNFPTTQGSFMPTHPHGDIDAFVAALNSSGTDLIYSTYLGGSSSDSAQAIALDGNQNAYVVGNTDSSDFPVTAGVLQNTLASTIGSNAFITKLNSTGSALTYSTYLGGNGVDVGNAVSLESSSLDVYVAGSTTSTNFPTTAGAFQTAVKSAPGSNAFVAKITQDASALVYSTVLGGSGGSDQANAITHDSQGIAYVAGVASSFDFPVTAGAFQGSKSGAVDMFFTKLSSTGGKLVYSTFLGGKAADGGQSIALDSANNAYIGGSTSSSDLPTTAGVLQPTSAGAGDGFVAEFAASAGSLLAPGKVKISPTRLNFGKVLLGSKKHETATIQNVGNKKTGAVTVQMVSASSGPFVVSSNCHVLAPGRSCKATVFFTPQNTTLQSAHLEVFDDAVGSPQMIPISGAGKARKK